jgi:hypothetical protein
MATNWRCAIPKRGLRRRRETLYAEHVSQHLSRMVARIHLVIDPREVAVLVDEKAHTARMTGLIVGTCTIRQADPAIGIAQQRKRKFVLLGEGGVLFDIVEADAQDLDIILFEIADLIAEPATLSSSSGSICLRIEP